MSKQQDAWEKLFIEYNIIENVKKSGYFEITSADFKKFHLEPRLLTKFDHSFQLPEVMKNESLSILPTSGSTWKVGKYRTFVELPPLDDNLQNCEIKKLPSWLESLKAERLTNEGAVLNAASASGILEDFCGTSMISTITGKSRSGAFDFEIEGDGGLNEKISVSSLQIEIDGGFESHQGLHLFEVKKRYASDLNVRQLYFPFRAWHQRISKDISTIYMTYVGDIFTLFQYEFADTKNYSSVKLIKSKKYLLAQSIPTKQDLISVAKKSQSGQNQRSSSAPFPQADNVGRLFELMEFLGDGPKTVQEIALEYDFDQRQSDYYFNALKFLDLAQNATSIDGIPQRELSRLGQDILAMPFREKVLGIARQMTQILPIGNAFLKSIEGVELNLELAKTELANSLYADDLTESTISRRAQTILAWVKWLTLIPEISE